jgi:two-component system, LytTR family, response regulator AlgR
MDGLEAAERLASLEPPPAVILVTAYPDHALDAFERHVADYLVKPVRQERLYAALQRVQVSTRPQRDTLLETGRSQTGRSHFCAPFRGGLRTVPIDEAIYLQAEQKYVVLRHPDGRLLLDESLRSLEKELGKRFVRIHRNALVAVPSIAGLEKDADGATLIRLRGCDERLTVSRRHLPALRQLLRAGSRS